MPAVGTRKINNVDCEVYVSALSGDWTIKDEEGATLGHGNTLEKAVAQARNALNRRKVKVNVPFYLLDGRNGTATGKHGGSSRKTLAVLDGKRETLDGYTTVFTQDTPQGVRERHAELTQQGRAVQRELRQIEADNTAKLSTLVEEAIAREEETA